MAKMDVRKQWQTPHVFVLGAEGTEAYAAGGKNEAASVKNYFTHNSASAYNKVGVTVYVGYES